MRTFEYTGFDTDGRPRKGLVEALDSKAARETLARDGILARRIIAPGDKALLTLRGRRGFDADSRAVVYRELAALLRAGLPLVNALGILIDSPELGRHQSLLAKVRDSIREGSAFADSVADASDAVSLFEKALIIVGERAGTLNDSLERLAVFIEEQEDLRSRIRTAMAYPAIVVVVALLVAAGVFCFVLPQTSKFLEEMRIPLPGITRFVMGTGDFIATWILPVGLAVVGTVFYVRHRAQTDESFRRTLDRRAFSLPVFGEAYKILVNLRFSRTLSILMRGGVSAVEGMGLAGRATGSSWVACLADNAAESVKGGASVADAVRLIPPLAASLPGWIQAGEASGELDNLLQMAAERYQRQWNRFVARSLSLLEPALILVLGGLVLVICLSILLPIMAANQMLQ